MEPLRQLVKSDQDYQKIISRLLENLIRDVILHPVRLTLLWPDYFNGYIRDLDSRIGDYTDEEISEIQEFLHHRCNWDFIPYEKIFHLSAFSTKTGNDDERGGGCGNMEFTKDDFIWETDNMAGITLKDLTEAVYRLKGSKYDYWYELYTNFRILECTDGHMKIEVIFDYGS